MKSHSQKVIFLKKIIIFHYFWLYQKISIIFGQRQLTNKTSSGNRPGRAANKVITGNNYRRQTQRTPLPLGRPRNSSAKVGRDEEGESQKVRAEQHLFQLKMEPQFYSGLPFIGEVTLSSAQDSISTCSSQTCSHILSDNDEYRTACGTMLTTILLQDPGDNLFTLKMRNRDSRSLFVSGKNVLQLSVMAGLWQPPWHHEESSRQQDWRDWQA